MDLQPIRLLHWNIRDAVGDDGRQSPGRIADRIGSIAPDAVCLNEVTRGVLDEIRRGLDERARRSYVAVWRSSDRKDDDAGGNAILSLGALEDSAALHVETPGRDPRVTVAARVVLGAAARLWLFATHLDQDLPEVRAVQAAAVRSWIDGFADPRVLAGDLNAKIDSPELAALVRDFDAAPLVDERGQVATHPLGRIDHVLVSRAGGLRVGRVEIIATGAPAPSDHRPLLVDVIAS